MKRKFSVLTVVMLVILVNLPNQSIYAQGDLMIMPKRLVFDGNQRSQEINLANTGKDTAIYAISFVNYKMTESGNFKEIDKPEEGQQFAEDFLRYFPRRVTLAPNEAQTIRVQLTRTGNLEEGEYRSHMYFRAVEDQSALGEENTDRSDAISIQIKTVFGISIPIIIRRGKSNTSVEISNMKMMNIEGNQVLSLDLIRSGNMSVYGDITVEHVSSTGTVSEVGIIKGISVYTPNNRREVSLELLNYTDEINYETGKLRITYKDSNDKLFADSELLLE